jgi:hypothetical protein
VHGYLQTLPGDITIGEHPEADWWRLERPKCDKCGRPLVCHPQSRVDQNGVRQVHTVRLSCANAECEVDIPLDGGQ